jgi:uncharacterized membrane protein HdeD (DUF308 family)
MQGTGVSRNGSPTWAVLLGVGVVGIILGLVIVANIWGSLRFLTIMVGLVLLFAGVVGVAIGARRGGGGVVAPIVAIIGGVVLLFWPDLTLKALAVVFGLTLIFWGGIQSGIALSQRREGRGGLLIGGILILLLGVVIVAWPGPTLALLTTLVGVAIIAVGIAAVIQALAMRKA